MKTLRFSSPQDRQRGFTLIELLVVIAIIAVLAAVVFTVSRKAIDSSQSAKCAGNLRGIFVHLGAYAADNNGKFPDGNSSSFRTTTEFVKTIDPYVPEGDRRMFYCPAHKKEDLSVYSYTSTRWKTGGISYHYYTVNGTSGNGLRTTDGGNQLIMSDKFNGNEIKPSVVTTTKNIGVTHSGGLNLMRLNGSIEFKKYGTNIKTW